MTKKILFVANVCKEHLLKFHVPTIKMLKDAGWYVDVACSGEDTVPYCDNQYNMSWKRSPFSPKLFKGISELKKIINANNYDIIYCHTPVGGVAARIAARKARKKGTKVIYFAHGLHFYNGAPLKNWFIYYTIEKMLAKQTDAIITINDEDFTNSQTRLKVKSVYQVPGMGVDLSKFNNVDVSEIRKQYRCELKIPGDAYVLIYLAELIDNKNQKLLVDALRLVVKEKPNTFLVLAGMDHTDGKFIEYVNKTEVSENIKYLGWRSDKENLYAMADLCTASSIREGFGLNLVEALAIGLPIVATNNRGHRTIVTDDKIGFLVKIGDTADFAEKIIKLQNDKMGVLNTVEYRKEVVKRFSEDKALKEIYSILEDSLETN